MAEETKPVVAAGNSGGSSRLIVGLLAANFLVMVVGGGLLYMKTARASTAKPGDAKAAEAKAGTEGVSPDGAGPTFRLADFVIHLRNPEADRYARVSFELELGTEEDKTFLTPYLPRIRDVIIAYLSDRTAEELRGSEGLERIKRELRTRIDGVAPGRHVRNLYIADFVIQ